MMPGPSVAMWEGEKAPAARGNAGACCVAISRDGVSFALAVSTHADAPRVHAIAESSASTARIAQLRRARRTRRRPTNERANAETIMPGATAPSDEESAQLLDFGLAVAAPVAAGLALGAGPGAALVAPVAAGAEPVAAVGEPVAALALGAGAVAPPRWSPISGTSSRRNDASCTPPRGVNAILVAGFTLPGVDDSTAPLPGGPPHRPRIGLGQAMGPAHG